MTSPLKTPLRGAKTRAAIPKITKKSKIANFPDPHEQPLEFLRACLAGDERALTLQRERQRAASQHLRATLEAPPSPENASDYDLLRALDENRRAEGRTPLVKSGDEAHERLAA